MLLRLGAADEGAADGTADGAVEAGSVLIAIRSVRGSARSAFGATGTLKHLCGHGDFSVASAYAVPPLSMNSYTARPMQCADRSLAYWKR